MALTIRPLLEDDLPAAKRIVAIAFGTFLGIPAPETYFSDRDYVGARWPARHTSAFGADLDGRLVGSNFVTCWGSFGFFGPLTVDPEHWDQGIGQLLMEPVMECLEEWQVTHAGLFTFPHSPKHIGLYQKYGFWPRFLTAVMSKPVSSGTPGGDLCSYSGLSENTRSEFLSRCRELANGIHPGLDLTAEIETTTRLALGDTVLLTDGDRLTGFAICHCGKGTEAGTGNCYAKFAAVEGGDSARQLFNRLLDDCESLAARRGMGTLQAGVNLSRQETYRCLLERGFRTSFQGVAMHRPNSAGYSRPGVWVIDDWR